jgi:hypothetical protein
MINQELIDYVRNQLRIGLSESDIRDILIQSGWSEDIIDEVFFIVLPSNMSAMAQLEKVKSDNKKGRLFRVFATAFILVLGVSVFSSFINWKAKNKQKVIKAQENDFVLEEDIEDDL